MARAPFKLDIFK